MKTLIVYEKDTGNISFTQSINGAEDVEYASIIADVPKDRNILKIEGGEVVLEEIAEVKEAKEQIKNINVQLLQAKKNLLLAQIKEDSLS